MMHLNARAIAALLESLGDPRVYPKPIYYHNRLNARMNGGAEMPGLTVASGLRHVSRYERAVLWVEGDVHEAGRFRQYWPWDTSHANVMIFDKPSRRVIVFEPALAEYCTAIDRVSLLAGGGSQRALFAQLKVRRRFTVHVCFGTQGDTPTCRDECWAFLQRMHLENFDIDTLELRELRF
jgi:hypothetical protein